MIVRKLLIPLLVGSMAVGLTGCGETPGTRALTGGAIGAGGGALIGGVSGVGAGTGALVGAGAGALGGAVTAPR